MKTAPSTIAPKASECLRLSGVSLPGAGVDWLAAMNELHGWAMRSTAQGKLEGAEIESDTLHGASAEVRSARDLLSDALLGQLHTDIRSRHDEHRMMPELLYCRWAATHTDNMFDKELFLSLVTGTGPSPYRAESLVPVFTRHLDGRRTPRFGFERHSIELSQGTIFLLDPLVPHYASPLSPHQDSLLSLLQLRLPYRTTRERNRWIRLMAPQGLQVDRSDADPDAL